jgi:hypothetical protein
MISHGLLVRKYFDFPKMPKIIEQFAHPEMADIGAHIALSKALIPYICPYCSDTHVATAPIHSIVGSGGD